MLFEATVQDITWDGRCVLKSKEGKVYFAQGGIPGEKVVAEELSFKSHYGVAHIHRLLKSSSSRRQSPCVYQGFESTKCGACPWMIMDYPAQVEWKKRKLSELLKNEGLWDKDFKVLSAQEELGYRRRVYLKKCGSKLGYLSSDTHAFVSIDKCLLMSPALNEKFEEVKATFNSAPPSKNNSMEEIFINESGVLSTGASGSGASFEQVNARQNELLKGLLKDYLEKLPEAQIYLELFAGSGNLTQSINQNNPQKMHLFESDERSCERLKEKFPDSNVYAKDIFDLKTFDKVFRLIQDSQVLLLDPPREGFENLSSWVAPLSKLEKIVYVSCSPETWARDVRSLRGLGWEMESIAMVDMFPQTPHLEIFSTLKRSTP